MNKSGSFITIENKLKRMKNSKTPAESSKATAPKNAKAKGADEKVTSAKDAKKVEVTKDTPVKHRKP
ncbi:hypothetical protein D3C87_968600 [compost metagenome]